MVLSCIWSWFFFSRFQSPGKGNKELQIIPHCPHKRVFPRHATFAKRHIGNNILTPTYACGYMWTHCDEISRHCDWYDCSLWTSIVFPGMLQWRCLLWNLLLHTSCSPERASKASFAWWLTDRSRSKHDIELSSLRLSASVIRFYKTYRQHAPARRHSSPLWCLGLSGWWV